MKKTAIKSPLFEVKQSSIHNLGIFATADIKKGTRIIEYVGEKISKAESERRNDEWSQLAKEKNWGMVYIFDLNKRYDIDGNVEYNIARYINHSCEPNCEAVNIRGRIWIMALKVIHKGEELSYDYGYDVEHYSEHPCHCGTKSCVGYIVQRGQWRKLRRLLQKILNNSEKS